MTFDAGPQLQFLFHSDSSNNEWGYKFTVTALGLPDITISWMSDLQLLVARLMGRLASRTLALKSPHGETVHFRFTILSISQSLNDLLNVDNFGLLSHSRDPHFKRASTREYVPCSVFASMETHPATWVV